MTIIDAFESLPGWAKVVCGVIFTVWLIETILLPFKINMYVSSIRRIEGLIGQIKSTIEVNKSIDEDYRKMMELMKALLSRGGKKDERK